MAIANPAAKIAHHIETGAFEFPYEVDARHAVAGHPLEWSFTPWDPDDASEARQRLHDRRVAEAAQRGEEPPPPPAEPDLNDEEREIIAEHRRKQAAAKDLIDAKAAEEAKKRDEETALDEARAVLASQPSLPPRRPQGRAPTKKPEPKPKPAPRVATENQFNEE